MARRKYGIGGKRGHRLIILYKLVLDSKHFTGDDMDAMVLASVLIDALIADENRKE